jgi:hypothetical protein
LGLSLNPSWCFHLAHRECTGGHEEATVGELTDGHQSEGSRRLLDAKRSAECPVLIEDRSTHLKHLEGQQRVVKQPGEVGNALELSRSLTRPTALVEEPAVCIEEAQFLRSVGDHDAAVVETQGTGDAGELVYGIALDGAEGECGFVRNAPRRDRRRFGVLDDSDTGAVADGGSSTAARASTAYECNTCQTQRQPGVSHGHPSEFWVKEDQPIQKPLRCDTPRIFWQLGQK